MATVAGDPLELFTVAELAKLCKTGQSWIKQGCRNRTIPFAMVGGSYRFTREQVAEIIAARVKTPARTPRRDELAERRAGRAPIRKVAIR